MWKKRSYKGYEVFLFRPGYRQANVCKWQGKLEELLGVPLVVLAETDNTPIPENIFQDVVA